MNYSLHNGRRTEWFLEVFQITAHCRPVFQPIFYHVYVMLGQIKKKRKLPNDIGEWGCQINTELFLSFGSTTSVSSRKKDKYFLSPIAKKAEMKF